MDFKPGFVSSAKKNFIIFIYLQGVGVPCEYHLFDDSEFSLQTIVGVDKWGTERNFFLCGRNAA